MKDAKGHGSDPRNGSGLSNAAQERVALRMKADQRKFAQSRTSIRNINPPAMPGDVAHLRGIVNATAGKTLAAISAMGTNQNIPPPKIGGGN